MLEQKLKQAIKSGIALQLDNKLRKNRYLSDLSHRKFKQPYHAVIVKLNQGLMKNYEKLTFKEIAAVFDKKADCVKLSNIISKDCRNAVKVFGIDHLMKRNITSKGKRVNERDKEITNCIICNLPFTPTEDSLCGHRKCFGIPEPKKEIRKCLKCGKDFMTGPLRTAVCLSCEQTNYTLKHEWKNNALA